MGWPACLPRIDLLVAVSDGVAKSYRQAGNYVGEILLSGERMRLCLLATAWHPRRRQSVAAAGQGYLLSRRDQFSVRLRSCPAACLIDAGLGVLVLWRSRSSGCTMVCNQQHEKCPGPWPAFSRTGGMQIMASFGRHHSVCADALCPGDTLPAQGVRIRGLRASGGLGSHPISRKVARAIHICRIVRGICRIDPARRANGGRSFPACPTSRCRRTAGLR